MKNCPKCKSVYYDETLEFCMEDGSSLINISPNKDEIPTVITKKVNNITTENTLEFSNASTPIEPSNYPNIEKKTELNSNKIIDEKITTLKEKVSYQGIRTIEIMPIILALANNYWQWLYLNRSNYRDTISFVFSIDFSVWFFLFVFGLISCFIALKYGKNRGFAITSLVILAINLLLSVVPLK